MADTELPWERLMAFGFGVLQLSPASFWSMSLPELSAAMQGFGSANGASGRVRPVHRTDLERLMARYPDTVETGEEQNG